MESFAGDVIALYWE